MTWVTPEPTPPPEDDELKPQAEQIPVPDEPTPAAVDSAIAAQPVAAEPPIDPLEDTNPTPLPGTAHLPEFPPADPLEDTSPTPALDVPDDLPMWRRAVGLALLLAAATLTFIAGLLIAVPLMQRAVLSEESGTQVGAPATATPPVAFSGEQAQPGGSSPPTLSPEQMVQLLSTPPYAVAEVDGAIPREDDPFTIIPERPRGEVITYTVQPGDTITAIAQRFGLSMDTIAWSNDREVVFSLRPGAEMNILPVDGVYHRVYEPETIQQIADRYHVDVYSIINSEFNNLFGATPETELPSGTRVVVPGGTSTTNDWTYNPVVERSGGSGGGGSSEAGYISFAPGEPGSCGRQPNPGHTGGWLLPASGYSWSRGFTAYHTGVDLASTVGAAVFAASTGRVIYAGWNNWGYGRLIVVAHGPFTTLYGHLDSINVSCGQMVNAGQVIGAIGSTGNSSGPHLHFEIRYNDIPTDPALYLAF